MNKNNKDQFINSLSRKCDRLIKEYKTQGYKEYSIPHMKLEKCYNSLQTIKQNRQSILNIIYNKTGKPSKYTHNHPELNVDEISKVLKCLYHKNRKYKYTKLNNRVRQTVQTYAKSMYTLLTI